MKKNEMKENALNVQNRTIFCHDNLEILQGINNDCIDLIYLDPPFNKDKVFTAPIGSAAEGASFSDIFRQEDVKDEWAITIKEDNPALYELLDFAKKADGKNSYNFCYLAYMSIRLLEIQRILKDSGSVYLHCDSTMSHYLKLMLDCIFGEKNFRNEIVWKRTSRGFKGSQHKARCYNVNTDIIYFYSKKPNSYFNMSQVLEAYKPGYIEKTYRLKDEKGAYYLDNAFNRRGAPARPNLCYTYNGITPPYESGWMIGLKKMQALEKEGEIITTEQTIKRKIRPKEGTIRNNLWDDINNPQGKQSTGYPTQKPLTLLERIIKASSNEGDMVLDPFCGCATTCVAAEKLNRQWIGVDVGEKAHQFVKDRLVKEAAGRQADLEGDMKNGKLSADLYWDKKITFRTSPPKRSDSGYDPIEQKYVYIISHPNFKGEYKVGIAKDWKSRLNSYQTSDPERDYKCEFYYLTPHYRKIEAAIHEKFENKHEWVTADFNAIKKEIENWTP